MGLQETRRHQTKERRAPRPEIPRKSLPFIEARNARIRPMNVRPVSYSENQPIRPLRRDVRSWFVAAPESKLAFMTGRFRGLPNGGSK
jgi:hypothetical protein